MITQDEIKIKARGKVNLSLNVTGVQGNMHTLDGITASVDIFDIVTVQFNDCGETDITFVPLADENGVPVLPAFDATQIGHENTVASAVALLQQYRPTLGARIVVKKGIPLGGGLGGSGADAAAVLVAAKTALPEIFASVELYKKGVSIGSDVPALCVGGTLRMFGVGDCLTPVANTARLHLAVVGRGTGVSSKAAYELFDQLYSERKFCPSDIKALTEALGIGDNYAIAAQLYNALTLPARQLSGDIDHVLHRLSGESALAVFMTGSGNCCCGVFPNAKEAQEAVRHLSAEGLWAKYTVTEKEGCTVLSCS